MTDSRYTPEEDAAIIAQWPLAPLCHLRLAGRTAASIEQRAQKLVAHDLLSRTVRAYGRPWTEAENDLVREWYGLIPEKKLGRQLNRSAEAVHCRAFLLGLRRKDQHLTASDLARILGIDQHAVKRLADRGWLRLKRAPFGAVNRRWHVCTVAALERFLRQHPAQYVWRRIEDEPWRGIGRQAHERAGFLTTAQVAAMKGCSSDWVIRHCRNGMLPAERAETHGGTGQFLIRRRDAEAWTVRGKGGAPVPVRGLPVRRPKPNWEPRARPSRLQATAWRAS